MAKISFYDIATVLVEHNQLAPQTANEFVRTFFDIIQERLTIEQQVKIKGLGTFKIVSVDARESINVNTGERITIDGHQKISFVPDTAMKELINKPFSQFETVILNDGVNFDDALPPEAAASIPATPLDSVDEQAEETENHVQDNIQAPAESQPITEEQEPIMEKSEPIIEEQEPPIEESPIQDTSTAPQPEAQPESELVSQHETQSVQQPAYTAENDAYANEDNQGDDSPPSHLKPVLIHVVYTVIIATLAAFGGYWYGSTRSESKHPADNADKALQPKAQVQVIKAKPVAVRPTTETDSAAMPTVKKDTIRQQHTEPQPQKTDEQDYAQQYAKMDVRVRTGAYNIVGEDFTVTVRKGETVTRLAKRTLGDGMECYIEVFNGMSDNTTLTEGQTIKIPKLKLKKK